MGIRVASWVFVAAQLGCGAKIPAPAAEGSDPALVILLPAPSTPAQVLPSVAAELGPVAAAAPYDEVEAEAEKLAIALGEDTFTPAQVAADLRLQEPKLHVGSLSFVHADSVRVITAELDGQPPLETLVIAERPNALALIFRPQKLAGHPWLLIGAVGSQESMPPRPSYIKVQPVQGSAQHLVGLLRPTGWGSDGFSAERLELFVIGADSVCTPMIGYVGGAAMSRYLPIAGPSGMHENYASQLARAVVIVDPKDASQQVLQVETDVLLGHVTHQPPALDYLALHKTRRYSRALGIGCAALTSRFQAQQAASQPPASPSALPPAQPATAAQNPDQKELSALAELFGPLAREVRNGPAGPRKSWLLANAAYLFPGTALAAEFTQVRVP